ncbi:hypothetical protein DD238_000764 [Peronospora effusa]|uniref:Uncharacterized protein n=1 Tax=Peronospora effusa TaxID=542832 RepID=A0A3M6VNV9_9STRA|nr:hypothetical protein DD238_000764 [Peronospora effusa]RQM17615.1 hypothetical protein DD237_001587 [Peronospora effusa]
MTTISDEAALEPNKEPQTSNGTPSPVKCNLYKTKRLLPKELRPTRKDAEDDEIELDDQNSIEEKEEASTAESSTIVAQKSSSLAREEIKLSHATGTTATRLHSLYASSLLSHKRRQLIPGANVPNIFHVTDLPLDIVPKTKLSILTAFPFPFTRVNSQIKKQALHRFVAGSAIQSTSHSNAMRWQQALHYFVHPADSVPASMLLNHATGANTSEQLLGGPDGERERVEKAFFTARWNTWQKAFRDVYMNFRQQGGGKAHDSSFYLRSSDFVVYFEYEAGSESTAKDAGDISSIINLCRQHDSEAELSEKEVESKCTSKGRLRAVMSQSSGRTRKALHHLNVAYTMPYINTNQTQREVGEFHMLAEELEANRFRNRDNGGGMAFAPIAPENMHGADSLLLFHGHDAVHGLYEFLINRAPMSNQDVPELYALHPFTNASIQSLQVTSFGRVGGASLAANQSSRSTTLFRTEIVGFCFALSIARLLAVLKDEWETMKLSYGSSALAEESSIGIQKSQIALRTYMEAMAGTERLNAVKLDEQIAKGGNEKNGIQKRQQELEFSKRRVEAVVVTKMENHYNVETTTRSIVRL